MGTKGSNIHTVNARGKVIEVGADGWAVCGDCGGEYHPDDMRNSSICNTCHNDLHADDWTMEDA